MPAEATHQRARDEIERSHEDPVVEHSLPSAVEPRRDGKSLRDNAHVGKADEKAPELRDAVLQQHRRVVVLEPDLHQLRQRIQPRHAIVDLKNRAPAGRQDAPAFVDEALRMGRVLNDAVGVDQVERALRKRQLLAVFDEQPTRQALLLEVRLREVDRRSREVDPSDRSAAACEAREIDAGAAADLENTEPAAFVKRNQAREVVQLLEMLLIEIVKEAARSDRMARDLEVVDMAIPVRAHLVGRGHGREIIIHADGS